jgi:hypothetical protein
MNSIANETEFVEVDAFLNAEAAHAKDLGLESDTAVEVAYRENMCAHMQQPTAVAGILVCVLLL